MQIRNIKIGLSCLLLFVAISLLAQQKNLKPDPQFSSNHNNNLNLKLSQDGIKYWQKKIKNIQLSTRSKSFDIQMYSQLSLNKIAFEKNLLNLKSKYGEVKVHFSDQNGSVVFLYADKLHSINLESKNASTLQLSDQALDFINANRDLLTIQHQQVSFELKSVNYDKFGFPHIKMQQSIEQIPIYGQEMMVHFKDNYLTGLSGRYLPFDKKQKLNVNPKITRSESIAIVKDELSKSTRIAIFSDFNKQSLGIRPAKAELVWTYFDEELILCWKVDYLANIHERYLIFVEAQNGTMVKKQNLICGMAGLDHKHDHDISVKKSLLGPLSSDEVDLNGKTKNINVYEEQGVYYMIDTSKPMFDALNSQIPQDPRGAIATLDQRNTVDGDLFFVANNVNNWTGYETEVSAHFNAAAAHDYFLTTFNRNSIDGRGGSMFSAINVAGPNGESMDNASWNGYFISYGNGQEFRPLAAALDVAAHEMSHGVIQNTANLIYEFQAGALNESFADIFGAMVDREDWNMGEDIVPTSLVPSGTLRNLANPNNGGSRGDFYWQPAHMNEYVNLGIDQDNGGVHINSGIPNKAFFNFATAVGKAKAEQVFYHALTNFLTQNAQFIDCRIAVVQSALELYDQDISDAAAQAFDAVGIIGNVASSTNDDRDELPEGLGIDHMLVHDIDGNEDGTLFDFDPSTGQFLQVSPSLAVPKADHIEDGSLAIYVGSDENIYISDLTESNPMTTAQALTTSGGWRKAIISPDGKLIAALTTEYDNQIIVYAPDNQSKVFEFFNPSTSSDITSIDTPEYGDAIEFNHSGEYILYDAYNIVSNVFSTSEISYWDIGLLEVWDNTQDDFADGDIFKVFAPQSNNISIANPSFANNTNDVITLDFLDSDDGDILVLAADLINGEVNVVAQTSGFAGYPSYAPGDDFIAFTDFINDEDQIKTVALNIDKISAAADPVTYIEGGRWPVWYVQGSRSFEQPLAAFDANIKAGEGPLTINFFDQSTNNPISWSWTFEGGNPSSSDQENPIVTFENEGKYNVILTVENPAGSDSEIKNDYIDVLSSVSIEEIGLENLSIFPVPADDYIQVRGSSINPNLKLQLTLVDQNGKLIKQKTYNGSKLNVIFEVSNLPSGNYQMIIKNENKQHLFKVLIH